MIIDFWTRLVAAGERKAPRRKETDEMWELRHKLREEFSLAALARWHYVKVERAENAFIQEAILLMHWRMEHRDAEFTDSPELPFFKTSVYNLIEAYEKAGLEKKGKRIYLEEHDTPASPDIKKITCVSFAVPVLEAVFKTMASPAFRQEKMYEEFKSLLDAGMLAQSVVAQSLEPSSKSSSVER